MGNSSAVERRSYKPNVVGSIPACPTIAPVAQSVEHRFCKPVVVRSIRIGGSDANQTQMEKEKGTLSRGD